LRKILTGWEDSQSRETGLGIDLLRGLKPRQKKALVSDLEEGGGSARERGSAIRRKKKSKEAPEKSGSQRKEQVGKRRSSR